MFLFLMLAYLSVVHMEILSKSNLNQMGKISMWILCNLPYAAILAKDTTYLKRLHGLKKLK